MAEYTYSEAFNVVMNMRNRFGGTMPTKQDYEDVADKVDIEDLVDALGVRARIKETHCQPYAAVNIEILREMRRRDGRPDHLIEEGMSEWIKNSTVDFSKKPGR